MTEEEIMEHILTIYKSLETLTVAVKMLLDESTEKNVFDEDIKRYFDGVKYDKKGN